MQKKIIDIYPPGSSSGIKEGPSFKLPEKKKGGGLAKKITILIFLAFVLTVATLHFVFARVRIEIWPETKIISFEEKITADLKKETNADLVSSKTIPAKTVETEKSASQEFPASGKITKEEKAHGKITVFNNYQSSQTLVANTRFQLPSENVMYFRSVKTTVVPAKSQIEIDVVADRAGEEYNIGPSTFSLPGLVGSPQYYSIYGKSFSAMEGGFKGEVPKVTQEDLDRAKNILTEELFNAARETLKNQISTDSVLLDGATKEEVEENSSSVQAGTETKSFSFQLKVKSRALVFSKTDLDDFAREYILNKVAGDEKIKSDSLQTNYSPESVDFNAGKIILKLNFSAKIYSDIDTNSLKQIIKNKTLTETKTILENQPKVEKVDLKPWPFWVKKVPDNLDRIQVQLSID
jgi:hypothetical protein